MPYKTKDSLVFLFYAPGDQTDQGEPAYNIEHLLGFFLWHKTLDRLRSDSS